MRDEPMIKLIC